MKKAYLYPIKIESCKEGGFIATCRSLQCYAEGETVDEAVDNLRDVIRVVLEYKRKNSYHFPDNLVSIENKRSVKGLNLAIIR